MGSEMCIRDSGYITWHNYDVSSYSAKSFSFSYAPGLHWKRAIKYLAGDVSVARSLGEAKELSACGAKGPESCQHCTSYANCTGPFPFATGWLFGLSAPLARALLGSAGVAADVERTRGLLWPAALRRPVFEDIWLGAALHRFLPAEPIAYVHGVSAQRLEPSDLSARPSTDQRPGPCGGRACTTTSTGSGTSAAARTQT